MKVALLIDGGHLRSIAGGANKKYDNNFIEAFAKKCAAKGEDLWRVLYYDCPQYRGHQKRPVSGTTEHFTASDTWMDDLASRDLFAVRRGTLAFRGWVLRAMPSVGVAITDADFKPTFEQKGVDMRIGLDIANISAEAKVERILLVSADADLVPAMKQARKAGLQVVAVELPTVTLRPNFLAHADYRRAVALP